MTLNGQNEYAVTSSQKVICYGRNVRLVLVLLNYLFTIFAVLVGENLGRLYKKFINCKVFFTLIKNKTVLKRYNPTVLTCVWMEWLKSFHLEKLIVTLVGATSSP